MASVDRELGKKRGGRVKELLSSYKMRQIELADKINVTAEHLSAILNGKRTLTLEHAQSIAKLFGVRFEWIMCFDDFKTQYDRIEFIEKRRCNRRDLISDLIALHGYAVAIEKVFTVERKDSEEEQLKADKKALAEWRGSSCHLQYPPGISDDDILKRAHNTSPEPIIAITAPSGPVKCRYIEHCEYERILKNIDDYIEMQLSFLFRNLTDGAKEYWG